MIETGINYNYISKRLVKEPAISEILVPRPFLVALSSRTEKLFEKRHNG